MKYVFNEDGAWVFRDHLGVYVEEEHEEEEQYEGNNDEIEAMFKTPLPVLSPEVASSSSWPSRIESWFSQLETNMHYIRETQSHIVYDLSHMRTT